MRDIQRDIDVGNRSGARYRQRRGNGGQVRNRLWNICRADIRRTAGIEDSVVVDIVVDRYTCLADFAAVLYAIAIHVIENGAGNGCSDERGITKFATGDPNPVTKS